MMNRIAVVSNRIPSLDRNGVATGGLAAGLGAALERSGGLWLGWDGTVSAQPAEGLRIEQSQPYTLASFPLSETEHAGYYLGFSNRTLWPVLHGRTDLLHFDPSEFATYRGTNERFARRLAAKAEGHDLIWVHDYHLFFVAQELRRLGISLPMGFFLHVPFPAPETLATSPCHRELVAALSAYDLVGFQTENDLHNFHEFVIHRLGGAVDGDGTVYALGRKFKTGAFPIGIDTRGFAKLAVSKETDAFRHRLRGCFRDQPGIIGVDRLDYTKGLTYRLRAFERMLESQGNREGRAFLLQIAAPSREQVPEYNKLKGELERISGRINARYAGVDWTPVRYINRAFSQSRLAALYRLSKVGLVTPIRDGMNLVAKEYVAAQSAQDPGVLVLSCFAGAAERLTGALLVNPYDIDGTAQAIERALGMSREERQERWSELITELRDHDIHDWRDSFIRALLATSRAHAFKARHSTPAAAPLARRAGSNGRRGTDPRELVEHTAIPVDTARPQRPSGGNDSDHRSG